MSRNLLDHQPERRAMSELAHLTKQHAQQRSTQPQGSQAIRLAVVEGYIRHELNLSDSTYSQFVDIEAPDGAAILIGSLAHTNFRVVYDPNFPDDPANITAMDTDNTGWGGLMYNVWLTASIGTDDPDYTTSTTLGQLAANDVPQNRIRIGSRVRLRQGLGTTSTVEIWVIYQVRMTLGWQ